jgi:hypothetical protein
LFLLALQLALLLHLAFGAYFRVSVLNLSSTYLKLRNLRKHATLAEHFLHVTLIFVTLYDLGLKWT